VCHVCTGQTSRGQQAACSRAKVNKQTGEGDRSKRTAGQSSEARQRSTRGSAWGGGSNLGSAEVGILLQSAEAGKGGGRR
jgi:hypothetical protein